MGSLLPAGDASIPLYRGTKRGSGARGQDWGARLKLASPSPTTRPVPRCWLSLQPIVPVRAKSSNLSAVPGPQGCFFWPWRLTQGTWDRSAPPHRLSVPPDTSTHLTWFSAWCPSSKDLRCLHGSHTTSSCLDAPSPCPLGCRSVPHLLPMTCPPPNRGPHFRQRQLRPTCSRQP